MTQETLNFNAEVSRLLELVARSLYADRQIFLRELISNASDACERLKFLSLTDQKILGEDTELAVTISLDKRTRSISITDNGIGMNREDLIENLGTIARSGTAAFADALEKNSDSDTSLIGQFGVGFYSVFMVADHVEVLTRKAGEKTGWKWISEGGDGFSIEEEDSAPLRGTKISLHLREDAREFREALRVRTIVREYADHIALPIMLDTDEEPEQLNEASAIWTRPAKEIDDSQYEEFYRYVSHSFDHPLYTMHFSTEGRLAYTALLFVPTMRPLDIMDPNGRRGVRLYVRRVFITDEYEDLLPSYLRFLRGVVDSEDLPLNISRDTLQDSPLVARIQRGLVRHVVRTLQRQLQDEPSKYAEFWSNFGAVLKEGIYHDPDRRDDLINLSLFNSTYDSDSQTTLKQYIERMQENQEVIYYLSAEELEFARSSPHLESFRAKSIEVLLLTDAIDDFWVQEVGSYDGKDFRSITRGQVNLNNENSDDSEDNEEIQISEEMKKLLESINNELGDSVKDVRVSGRLTDSISCLVADDLDIDVRFAQMLSAHGSLNAEPPRILEINPEHTVVKNLINISDDMSQDHFNAVANLFLDQARIAAGESLPDPAGFASRLAQVLEKSLDSNK